MLEQDKLTSIDSANSHWVQGWMDALAKVRDKLVNLQTDSNDPETQKQITAVFNHVKDLEKSSFHHAPTLIADLKTSKPKA